MKAIDLIRWAMNFTEQGTNRIVEDMKNAPLTQPCSNGGNHPLWNMGHLAYIEGAIRHVVIGEPNPVEDQRPGLAADQLAQYGPLWPGHRLPPRGRP